MTPLYFPISPYLSILDGQSVDIYDLIRWEGIRQRMSPPCNFYAQWGIVEYHAPCSATLILGDE